MAEALNSLYKAELIRNKGPWTGIDDVEAATAGWVEWYNTRRPHSSLDYMTPRDWLAAHPDGLEPQAPDDSQNPAA
jgi:putative transposase